ncbi:MAG: hypothetical protein JRN26_07150 [Nitrososphaerota archaeon]|jgi:hypothetical protein|nr:hypothetical protein [Nitrososphaerota archaeon]MDG6930212.1 hypothetical protein [Nitrososphaerota archaeon]MDG6931447.1 hypothetical protein [Nitrososphaerota archaeon]MDG6936638.1 hypothetical protein [Nitrososphaerota archaeon]MDG6944552.1 hypothetical protein [Nitrososphaerota archaeon]
MNDKDTMVEYLKVLAKNVSDEGGLEKVHNAKDLAIGVSAEAKLLGLFMFKSDDEMKSIIKEERKEIGEGLGNILYFVLRFAQMNNFDLTEELVNKLKVNAKDTKQQQQNVLPTPVSLGVPTDLEGKIEQARGYELTDLERRMLVLDAFQAVERNALWFSVPKSRAFLGYPETPEGLIRYMLSIGAITKNDLKDVGITHY